MVHRMINNERGVAMVEFAIILPLLVLLVFGTIEMGLLCYNKQVLTNATREGARCSINTYHTYTLEDITDIVEGYCDNMVLVDLKNSTGEMVLECKNEDDYICVNASYEYPFLFASLLGFEKTDIVAQTTMRKQ